MAEQLHRRLWLETAVIFAGWTVFGLLQANQIRLGFERSGRPPDPWHQILLVSMVDAYLWAFFTVAIFWLARRVPLERRRLLPGITLHLVAAVFLGLARTAARIEFNRRVFGFRTRPFDFVFWASSSENLLYYSLLLGIAHAVLYYGRYRERERAAERLAAGLTEARLQSLKMQLQPHFLFNTLNAISALIPDDAKPARRMLARLGDLLRITLDHEATQEVTLREELAFLEPYLEIEQARLGERLTIAMEIAPDTLDARVPHLLLQPLVENAIRHGISTRIEAGSVEIAATTDGRVLKLEVRDDGRGVDRDQEVGSRRGVGLSNVRSRLEQLYHGDHRFDLENRVEGGVVVRIVLPFHRAENGAGALERSAPS